jgi:hypothetical protein
MNETMQNLIRACGAALAELVQQLPQSSGVAVADAVNRGAPIQFTFAHGSLTVAVNGVEIGRYGIPPESLN